MFEKPRKSEEDEYSDKLYERKLGKKGLKLKRYFNKTDPLHFIKYILTLFTILFTMFGILFIILAKAERGVQDQYNRTIGLRKIYYNVLSRAHITDIRVCACQPDRVERTTLFNGFKTTIYIYDKGGKIPRPGIILIHGNVWMGQKLSTYRLVAHQLSRNGFIVLTFDKIGFGESDDPFRQGPTAVAAAYDTVTQLEKAVEYLIAHTNVDPSNITLMGHSGGVSEALELGQKSDMIANVVAWVAPFDPTNQIKVEENQKYLDGKFHARYELLYGKQVPDWFEWELTGIVGQDPDIIWNYFRQEYHKPLILVLGEYDSPNAHPYVMKTYDSLKQPKDLIYLKRADHYLYTAQSLWWVFYDRSIAYQLVSDLVSILAKLSQ